MKPGPTHRIVPRKLPDGPITISSQNKSITVTQLEWSILLDQVLRAEGRGRELLKIDMIGGNCPVQAEGTIDGVPFYFRARWERWSMGIGKDPIGDPEWLREEVWGDGPFAAGWMPEDEARRFIEQCAAEYVAWKKGETT